MQASDMNNDNLVCRHWVEWFLFQVWRLMVDETHDRNKEHQRHRGETRDWSGDWLLKNI